MAKNSKRSIKITDLGDAISHDLKMYSQEVTDRVDEIGNASIQELVRKTRATAPANAKANHKHYRTMIASKAVKTRAMGTTYVWYVKPPGYRLTHLLVKGHAKKGGGRTRVDPFLANACDEVLPAYEAAIERTIANGE